jgi:hypothetical protein
MFGLGGMTMRTGSPSRAALVVQMPGWTRTKTRAFFGLIASAWIATGCATVSLAPRADQVRTTTVAADLNGCKVVGNVTVVTAKNSVGEPSDYKREFLNQVVGLGGNAAFVTSQPLGIPLQGVAYRCP